MSDSATPNNVQPVAATTSGLGIPIYPSQTARVRYNHETISELQDEQRSGRFVSSDAPFDIRHQRRGKLNMSTKFHSTDAPFDIQTADIKHGYFSTDAPFVKRQIYGIRARDSTHVKHGGQISIPPPPTANPDPVNPPPANPPPFDYLNPKILPTGPQKSTSAPAFQAKIPGTAGSFSGPSGTLFPVRLGGPGTLDGQILYRKTRQLSDKSKKISKKEKKVLTDLANLSGQFTKNLKTQIKTKTSERKKGIKKQLQDLQTGTIVSRGFGC